LERKKEVTEGGRGEGGTESDIERVLLQAQALTSRRNIKDQSDIPSKCITQLGGNGQWE